MAWLRGREVLREAGTVGGGLNGIEELAVADGFGDITVHAGLKTALLVAFHGMSDGSLEPSGARLSANRLAAFVLPGEVV